MLGDRLDRLLLTASLERTAGPVEEHREPAKPNLIGRSDMSDIDAQRQVSVHE